ncbi:MAG TPA: hypothetical protein VJN43_21225 [Bryobacteraceae bacterium]|nr:hypothetical protein [Bryobacteraceae bacterium]
MSLLLVSAASLFGQGPTLVGSGYTDPQMTVSPGQVVTFYVSGLKTVLPSPRSVKATGFPLPNTLAGISATITQMNPSGTFPVPLFSVDQINTCADPSAAMPDCLLTAVTVQIPFELFVPSFSGPPQIGLTTTQVVLAENGINSKAFQLGTVDANIHVLTTCTTTRVADTGSGLPCRPVVTHADGRFVSGPITSFDKGTGVAQPGEELVMYAVGLGKTTTAVPSGEASPASAPPADGVSIVFDYSPNASPQNPGDSILPSTVPAFAGLTSGFVGLYQINFVVPQPPPGTLPCLAVDGRVTSNLTISIARGGPSFDGARICVDVP